MGVAGRSMYRWALYPLIQFASNESGVGDGRPLSDLVFSTVHLPSTHQLMVRMTANSNAIT
jgi:hypothetical protein